VRDCDEVVSDSDLLSRLLGVLRAFSALHFSPAPQVASPREGRGFERAVSRIGNRQFATAIGAVAGIRHAADSDVRASNHNVIRMAWLREAAKANVR